jgi:hypothetical protein
VAKGKSTPKSGKQHRQPSKNGKGSKPPTTDPVVTLLVLARCLNELEKAGLRPRLKHGIVFTDAGYVLDIKDRWVARPLKKLGK